jgi:hypothetical protein
LPGGFVRLRDIDPTIIRTSATPDRTISSAGRSRGYEAGECVVA